MYKKHIGKFIASNGNVIVFSQLLRDDVEPEVLTLFNCMSVSSGITRKANDDFRKKRQPVIGS